MAVIFTSGGFPIVYPKDTVYLYKSPSNDCNIHFAGKLAQDIGIIVGAYIHICYDDVVPNIVYFVPWIKGDPLRDNSNDVPKGSKISPTNQPFRVCCKNAGLFNALKIPCGESKQVGAAQSGFNLTPCEVEILGRRAICINLEEIPGWYESYRSKSTSNIGE